MEIAVEPDFSRWLEVWRPLYGPAATAELQAAQLRFAQARTGSAEVDGAAYQRAITREARHSLGEYYTPAWLADFLLDRLEYRGRGTLLDPAAGAGVFLNRALERGADAGSLRGYELNPLTAACAAAAGLPIEVRDTLSNPGQQRFEFVAGNPPWVNWRYLSAVYRERIAPLWARYGLAPHPGLSARLGAGMDDISILFAFLCADRLLAADGRMGLLLSKSLLQSAGGGRGFRRLELRGGRHLNVTAVHEIEGRLPFAGATNQTVAMLFRVSDERTVFPVPYFRGDMRFDAEPVVEERTSPWIIQPAGRANVLARLRGPSPYVARVGVHTGGATGVFWIDIAGRAPSGLVTIRNRGTAGRRQWATVTAEVEPDFIRTLVRGRDVSAAGVRPSAHILLPHTDDGKPVPEAAMLERWPRTFEYFEQFREGMLARPHYLQHFARLRLPYWSMYDVGAYTFAPWRAVWREQSTRFECAVIGGSDRVADAKLVVLACTCRDEADYVAAMLNSTPAREFVAFFLLRVQMSTHVLRHLRLPRFDPLNPLHRELAASNSAGDRDRLASAIWEL